MGSPANTRLLRLRYPATCAVCLRGLEAGQKAEWNNKSKVAICIPCTQRRPTHGARASMAGGSAQAEASRRRANQHDRLRQERAAHPILGWLRQGLFPETDVGASWATGGEAEEEVGRYLEPLGQDGTVSLLHDRRIPGTRANIDHIAVAPSGIWVIDTKRYTGPVKREYRGGVFTGATVLSVRGRDRTSLVDGITKQLATVQAALGDPGDSAIPTRGVLCFVDAEWGWRLRPFAIDGVVITWPRALKARLAEDGPVDAATRVDLLRRLEASLPPAS